MPQARGDGGARVRGVDAAMQKACDDENKKADTTLQERLGIEDMDSRLACRHRSRAATFKSCDSSAKAHVHAFPLLFWLWYLGLTGVAALPPAEQQKKNHNSMARFEWTLTCGPDVDKKEEVVVQSNNAKARGVPLPEAWTQTTAADLQKECEKAAARLMALLMVETRERGATITCKSRP